MKEPTSPDPLVSKPGSQFRLGRRSLVKLMGMPCLLAGSSLQGDYLGYTKPSRPFEDSSLGELLMDLRPTSTGAEGIAIVAPDHAESGASVPITITSNLAGTRSLHILIEGNRRPWMTSIRFDETDDVWLATHCRMEGNAVIHAIVEASGQRIIASSAVQVGAGESEPDEPDDGHCSKDGAGTTCPDPDSTFRVTALGRGLIELQMLAGPRQVDACLSIKGRRLLEAQWGPSAPGWPSLCWRGSVEPAQLQLAILQAQVRPKQTA